MATPTLNQALDIQHATLQHVMKKQPPMLFAYQNYMFFNTFWKNNKKVRGGDTFEGHVVLGSEDNAKKAGLWDADTHNVKNITKKYTENWRRVTNNFSTNIMEMDINGGEEKIYDVTQVKYNAMMRDMIEETYAACFEAPTSSSDELSVDGLFSWLRLGTDDSTGGWTGYNAHYNDGSTPGSTYSVGGLTCSSTVNPGFASYYADHNGNLDDSLLVILDRAARKLNFVGPAVPQAMTLNLEGYSSNFSLYSNDNVIGTLNQLYAKSDDQMGRPGIIEKHYGTPYFKMMPFQYVDYLDDANVSLYGTDPIVGVNHNLIYPVVHTNWDFKVSKPRPRDGEGANHLVITTYADTLFTIFAEFPREAGFLISQQ